MDRKDLSKASSSNSDPSGRDDVVLVLGPAYGGWLFRKSKGSGGGYNNPTKSQEPFCREGDQRLVSPYPMATWPWDGRSNWLAIGPCSAMGGMVAGAGVVSARKVWLTTIHALTGYRLAQQLNRPGNGGRFEMGLFWLCFWRNGFKPGKSF